MTKAAFNALITSLDFSPTIPNYPKEGNVSLAVISDPAGDLWHLFVNNKPVKVKIVDKDSCFDFTERKVERRRKFSIRLKHGIFCCHVCVQYYINGTYHRDRCHEYQNITPDTIERLYDPDKALSRSDPEFGFVLVSNVERTDLLPMRKQFDKEKVYDQLERIVHHRFMSGYNQGHGNQEEYKAHYEKADKAIAKLLALLDMED